MNQRERASSSHPAAFHALIAAACRVVPDEQLASSRPASHHKKADRNTAHEDPRNDLLAPTFGRSCVGAFGWCEDRPAVIRRALIDCRRGAAATRGWEGRRPL